MLASALHVQPVATARTLVTLKSLANAHQASSVDQAVTELDHTLRSTTLLQAVRLAFARRKRIVSKALFLDLVVQTVTIRTMSSRQSVYPHLQVNTAQQAFVQTATLVIIAQV